jgi:hypothetical protein
MNENNNNKSEFDIYMEAVVPYMTTFMNELEDGNRHVVERTVAQIKPKFALDDAQETALMLVLFNLEMMYYGHHNKFPFEPYMGIAINTVVDILLKNWRNICDKRLAEPPAELMNYEDDDEVEEAINAYRDLLIDYYGTVSGKEKDKKKKTTKKDVFKAFFLPKEYHEPALCILNGFKEKMDGFFETGATQEAVANLLDNTIEKMMKLSNTREE